VGSSILICLPTKVYTITFYYGNNTVYTTEVVRKDTIAIAPGDPVKKMYNFTGWYSDENLTVLYDFNKPIVENISVYSKWEEATIEELWEENSSLIFEIWGDILDVDKCEFITDNENENNLIVIDNIPLIIETEESNIEESIAYYNGIYENNYAQLNDFSIIYNNTLPIDIILTQNVLEESSVYYTEDYSSLIRYIGSSRVIKISYNIDTIENLAFSNCGYLSSVIFESTIPSILGENVFNDNITNIYVPEIALDGYKNADGWDIYADKIIA
jgi:hypothetical protein